MMFVSRRPFLGVVLLASVPVVASPVAKGGPSPKKAPSPRKAAAQRTVEAAPSLAGWNVEWAEGALENRWSWRAVLSVASQSESRVVFGWKDAKNFALLRVRPWQGHAIADFAQFVAGRSVSFSSSGQTFGPQGQLELQKVGNRVRALWNGEVVGQTTVVDALAQAGTKFGWAVHGAKIEADSPQPTETVIFRDDFMRAQGPEDKEIPGEWKVAGVWKTSGSLGPKSDADLNPNPFVFRAQGEKESVARAGKWWWSDYSVSVSLRATQNSPQAPLTAGIEAFANDKAGLRGEIDFAHGVARLKSGDKTLAQSAPFDTEVGQWHRVRLEPGPGTAKLFVDGVLRVSAPAQRAEGVMALRAIAGGANFVDFDDVRVGQLQAGHEWGEGALPERFQKDRLMSYWASDAKAWKRDASGVWWHTGDFFGDTQLELPLPSLDKGEGFEFLLGADPQNPKSGARVEISRPDEKAEVRVAVQGSATQTIPLSNAQFLELNLSGSQKATLEGLLGKQKTGKDSFTFKGPLSLQTRGTKIGIRPLRDGQPLPPPQLQKVSLSSPTFERDNRPVIGVNITPVSEEIARQLGLPDATGAVVDNVEANSPAKKSGVREGDVIRGVDGARVTDVDSMRAAVGAVKPGASVKLEILRPQVADSGLDFSQCIATTPNVLDYSFTAAPTDWRASRGIWDVAERWTCSPQWSFFSGQNDVSPLLWSRFQTQGDWTLEAYLATPMDLTRGERSPSDLNISVGGDGRDLSSGYSFIFGGKNRSVNQIYRGDTVAWGKPFDLPPGVGDTHQDWFYVRLERRQTAAGVRFRYSVNGRELANYLDPKPLLDGGHIGFWTQNGGISVARVRLWDSSVRAPQAGKAPTVMAQNAPPKMVNDLGIWSARGDGSDQSAQLVLVSDSKADISKPAPKTEKAALQITNPRSGGDWTTYVTRTPFDLSQRPVLEWDYRMDEGVKINLYALVDNVWREIAWTGGASSTDRGDGTQLGKVDGVVTDDKWHHARFDLASALRSKGVQITRVESLALAAPDHDYLRAGLGGNHMGATYWVRDFKTSKG